MSSEPRSGERSYGRVALWILPCQENHVLANVATGEWPFGFCTSREPRSGERSYNLFVMNPYETPAALSSPPVLPKPVPHRVGPVIMALVLILAVLVGWVSQFVPAVRTVTMPRFGWIGLILCLNPLIFLIPVLRNPTRRGLFAAGTMTLGVGLIDAVQLILTGTVSVVTNPFTQRLNTSWLWSVLPLCMIGSYLIWHGRRLSNDSLAAPGSSSND